MIFAYSGAFLEPLWLLKHFSDQTLLSSPTNPARSTRWSPGLFLPPVDMGGGGVVAGDGGGCSEMVQATGSEQE